MDWKTIAADKERGLDGTSVRMTFGKRTASMWSPDYNSKKRGLVAFQEVAEAMFEILETQKVIGSGARLTVLPRGGELLAQLLAGHTESGAKIPPPLG